MSRAESVVTPLVEIPEDTEEPRCGAGPFSMANADTTSQVLQSAGFEDVRLRRFDLPIRIGHDLDEAVDFNLALGPAAEAIRLAGAEGDRMRPGLETLLRDALSEFAGPDGVIAGSSTWIVTARAPA
jgi:hypothetical protein